jgi:hypothetical protein
MPRLVRNGALERGIQYAAPLEFDRDRPGGLDRPPRGAIARKAGDDSLGI